MNEMALKRRNTKCYVFLTISYAFSSTKSENKRAEQVLPGNRGEQGERWPKQCIHM
jgi:hypothetical protein